MRRPEDLLVGGSRAEVRRALDTTEAIFEVFGRFEAYQTAHTAVVEGPLTATILAEALRRTQARHPSLRVRIEGGRFVAGPVVGGPAWVGAAVDAETIRAEAERSLHRPLGAEGELPWRVGFLRGAAPEGPHALILNVHHSLTDGLGSLRILSDLLTYCSEVVSGVPFGQGLPAREPFPPLDDVLAPHPTAAQLLSHRARNVLRRLGAGAAASPLPLAFERTAPAAERRTGIVFGEVPKESFAALHREARKHAASLNGVLSALALDALGKLSPHADTTLSTQVSLRSRCAPAAPVEHVGCFVSNVTTRHPLRDLRPLWVRAKELSAAVQARLDSNEAQIALRAGRGRTEALAASMRAVEADDGAQGRVGALSISNRGPVPRVDFGQFRLRALYSPASLHRIGPQLQLSLGTVDDVLCCTVSHPMPVVSERTARAFLEFFVAEVAAAGRAS